MASSSELLGLIAGSTQMPLLVAREAAAAGRRVRAVALTGITDPAIDQAAHEVRWLSWGDLPGFFTLLEEWRSAGVKEAIMAGKVEQQRIYDAEAREGDMERVLQGLPTAHTDQLLGAVANVLDGAGIELLPSTRFLARLIPGPGPLAGREPDEREVADIEHGWRVAKSLGAHDIGQTVVVKDRAVVAVEAMEGTDACIRRAGTLAGDGCVVVKVAKPDQDLRFDVPVAGTATLDSMVAAGATALAVEADITVVFDREALEARAAADDLAIVARGRD